MNQADNEAGSKAIDSLINYETVKVNFNAGDREAAAYTVTFESCLQWCIGISSPEIVMWIF